LTTAHVLAPIKWIGKLRANPDLQCSSSEAQNYVLSFGDFSLHGQRKVTRSAEGRAEALLARSKPRKNWMTSSAVENPAFAGMTSVVSTAFRVQQRSTLQPVSQQRDCSWIWVLHGHRYSP
jgi:hypothetical protein